MIQNVRHDPVIWNVLQTLTTLKQKLNAQTTYHTLLLRCLLPHVHVRKELLSGQEFYPNPATLSTYKGKIHIHHKRTPKSASRQA